MFISPGNAVQRRKFNWLLSEFSPVVALTPTLYPVSMWVGLNAAPGGVPSGIPLTKRTAWTTSAGSLGTIGTETFESFAGGATNPSISFPGTGITATMTGVTVATAPVLGRFNTTTAGNNYVSAADVVTITFSAPVSAFGMYVTDLGDFQDFGFLILTMADGGTLEYRIPQSSTSGSLSFIGTRRTGLQIVSATITRGGSYIAGMPTIDFFGIDDISIVAWSGASIVAGSYTADAYSPIALRCTFEDLLTSSDLTLRTVNDVPFGFKLIGSNLTPVASGVYSTDKIVGKNSIEFVGGANFVSQNILQNGFGAIVSLNFYVKRLGASTGDGSLMATYETGGTPEQVTVSIDATGKLRVDTFYTIDGIDTPVALLSTAALPVDTWTHCRIAFGNFVQPTVQTTYQVVLAINGAQNAIYNVAQTNGVNTVVQWGGFFSAEVRLGGRDASNFANARIDGLYFSSLVEGNPASFTVPTDIRYIVDFLP